MTYTIAIKLTNDTLQLTKFKNLSLDQAQEMAEGIWLAEMRWEDWAGVAIVDENNEIKSELEW